MQTICKDAYYLYFPKILKTFYLDRQYLHLYLAHKRKMVVAYLDNYKGKKISFKKHKEIPERLKYFSTIQFENNVLLCGGLNSKEENPEDPLSQQFDYVYDDSFLFDVKHTKVLNKMHMHMKRAKHCVTIQQDPVDQFNRLVLIIGGVYITYHKDLFKKTTYQKYHDTANVEYYSMKTQSFERYNAKLSIARHSAAACNLHNYTYVIGGHTVDHPLKYINTIERCHRSVPSSFFEKFDVKQKIGVDLNIQTLLSVAIPEDRGILIIGSSRDDQWNNEGFYIDLKDMSMKRSKFQYSVGPINDWKNSYTNYEQKINFLTEQFQILRFGVQACEWSLFDLNDIKTEKSKEYLAKKEQKRLKKLEKDKNKIHEKYIYDDGSHLYYEDNKNHNYY
ncbi:UNKNOWN [Stylonychia lemnae]|uniref:Kelch motif family protein n=1 Tax=Stylonychia lemnae TaxID=5949 RepID=A0A078AIG3_STYLE|nr:UNKNOWN [Stylonychia lemnae]|eukprot:CDW81731.1 UNKNOWN [Stylonychia lemnae]